MKTFAKKYVGKGKKSCSFAVEINLKMEELLKYVYEYKGKSYCTIEIAPMKSGADQYGRTHCAYVSVKTETETPVEENANAQEPELSFPTEETPKPKRGRKAKK